MSYVSLRQCTEMVSILSVFVVPALPTTPTTRASSSSVPASLQIYSVCGPAVLRNHYFWQSVFVCYAHVLQNKFVFALSSLQGYVTKCSIIDLHRVYECRLLPPGGW